ncbi:MAG: hypothetical protein HOP07_15875 [Bacteriovoracaceae bacterium]|nr:hypothetical protein [Bacteriovoracaceae bacterium]
MKKLSAILSLLAIGIFFFLKNQEKPDLAGGAISERQISSAPNSEPQQEVSNTLVDQSPNEIENRQPQSTNEERTITARVPAEVQNFKKQNKRRDASNFIKRNILNNKVVKVGKVSISLSIRAAASSEAKKGSDVLGEINGLVIFPENPRTTLEQGQFLVAFDHEKNSVAFFSGRLIVQTYELFDESLLKSLKFEVSEKSENDQSLKFVEFRGNFSEFDDARKSLIKLEGVQSVRAELIYGRKTRQ